MALRITGQNSAKYARDISRRRIVGAPDNTKYIVRCETIGMSPIDIECTDARDMCELYKTMIATPDRIVSMHAPMGN